MGSHITVHGLSKNQQGDSQRLLIAGPDPLWRAQSLARQSRKPY